MQHVLAGFERKSNIKLECPLDYTAGERKTMRELDPIGYRERFCSIFDGKQAQEGFILDNLPLTKYLKDYIENKKGPKRIPWEIEPILNALDMCEGQSVSKGNKDDTLMSAKENAFFLFLSEETDPLFSLYRDADEVYKYVISLDYAKRVLCDKLPLLLTILVLCDSELRTKMLHIIGQDLDIIISDCLGLLAEKYPDEKLVTKSILKDLNPNCNYFYAANSLYEKLIADRYSVTNIDEIPITIRTQIETMSNEDEIRNARNAYSEFRARAQNDELKKASKEFKEDLERLENLLSYETIFTYDETLDKKETSINSDIKERKFIEQYLIMQLSKSGLERFKIENGGDIPVEMVYSAITMGHNRIIKQQLDWLYADLYATAKDYEILFDQIKLHKKSYEWSTEGRPASGNRIVYDVQLFYYKAIFIEKVIGLFKSLVKNNSHKTNFHSILSNYYAIFCDNYNGNDNPDKQSFFELWMHAHMIIDSLHKAPDDRARYFVDQVLELCFKIYQASIKIMINRAIDSAFEYREDIKQKRQEFLKLIDSSKDPKEKPYQTQTKKNEASPSTLYESISKRINDSLLSIFAAERMGWFEQQNKDQAPDTSASPNS